MSTYLQESEPFLVCSILLAATFIIYHVSLIIYRLVWHPLASIPGPKLAASTNLYGAYHDLILGGSLVRKVAQLHEKYGPVVRISPSEVHVKDLNSYNQIFRVGSDFHKKWDFYNSQAIEGSLLNILDTQSARQRREAYSRYFSRDAIDKILPLVHRHIDKLLDVMLKAAQSGTPVDLSRGFRCLTADVIMDYSFRQEFRGLDAPNFVHPVIEAGDLMLVYAQWGLYFRKFFLFLDLITDWIPSKVLRVLSPQLSSMKKFQASCAQSMQKLKANAGSENSTSATIFDTILNPKANKNRPVPSDDSLTAESILMFLAGTDTTANALVLGTYEMLRQPTIKQKLRDELQCALILGSEKTTTTDLRGLPYLNAVVKESLRLSFGAPGRLPRVVPASGVQIGRFSVPAGFVISHSHFIYHTDDITFPNPMEFVPERWLGENFRCLERNLLPFSKGSRMCLGIHLATTQLLITFARLFQQIDMALHNTTPHDMEWGDYSVTLYKGHVKVLVKAPVMET